MTTPDDLALPSGLPGSGRRRYAAAMRTHAEGLLGDDELEAFRVLSARDGDQPALLGLVTPSRDPAAALEALRDELLALLHRLAGTGVAEARVLLARALGAPRSDPRPHAVVDRWLAPALEACADQAVAAALSAAAPQLPWTSYTYDDPAIGPVFPGAHAFCSLVGSTAPWTGERADLGLFLIAPRVLYRDHAHPAPELYLPLTGPHRWRFRPGAPFVPRAALAPVWNDPDAPHATRVGDVPFLALYAWLADPDAPARVVAAPDWTMWEKDAP